MGVTVMNIPSESECRKLFKEYDMLDNIVRHSEKVAEVTKRIVEDLDQRCAVNKELCIAASLLHDITKTRALTTKERHAESGGRLLKSLGYRAVGEIVSEHVTLREFDSGAPLTETEIVFYADKRVRHDEFVSVEERIVDLLERYGTSDNERFRIMKMRDRIIEVEIKMEKCLVHSLDDIFTGL